MTNDIIPNIQFGNSQNDFQTEKPLQNDALNVPAVIAGEPVDTDDFREPNMNNDIQEVMQDLANDPEGTVSEEYIAEQEAVAQEAFDNIYQLQVISKRIAMRGVGMRDYMALEGIAPGILSKRTTEKGFTYQPSQTNVEISQEAISDKIRAYAEKAYEVIHTLIVYVIKKAKELSQKYVSGKMKALAVKFKTLKAKNTDALQMAEFQRLSGLSDDDIINKLRECGLERLAATLKTKPETVVAAMKSVKTGASPVDVASVLGTMNGQVPAMLEKGSHGLIGSLNAAALATTSLTQLLESAKQSARMLDQSDALKKYSASVDVGETGVGKQTGLDSLKNIWSVLDVIAAGNIGESVNAIHKELSKADAEMKSFWKGLKDGERDNTAVYKEFRSAFYDKLRSIQQLLDEIDNVLKVASITALFSGAYVTKFAKGVASGKSPR